MKLPDDQITWKRIWSYWEYTSERNYPELLQPIAFDHITFKPEADLGIYGYDWLVPAEYEKRIEMVTENTRNFLWFGNTLNKGTLKTAENLVQAKGNSQLQAAVWLYATIKDFGNSLPDRWRGDGYRLLRSMEIAINPVLHENNVSWHFAMRNLIPNDYITLYNLENLILEDFYQIIELTMIKASLVTSHYKIVLYDSVGKGV